MTNTDNEDTNHRAASIGMRVVDVITQAAQHMEPSPECAADPRMVQCLARVRAACGELKAALIEYGELAGHD